jgi:hypothetical protein
MAIIKKAQKGVKQKGYTKSQKEENDRAWAAQEKIETSKPKVSFKEMQEDWSKKEKEETKKSVGKNDLELLKKGGKVKKAKNGKWIQKATASIKKRGTAGKCTPITKPGCTGRAKALAKTFKKMAKARKGK